MKYLALFVIVSQERESKNFIITSSFQKGVRGQVCFEAQPDATGGGESPTNGMEAQGQNGGWQAVLLSISHVENRHTDRGHSGMATDALAALLPHRREEGTGGSPRTRCNPPGPETLTLSYETPLAAQRDPLP